MLHAQKDTTWVHLGGAVRFNTLYTYYEGETFDLPTENRNGIFWDTFRIQAEGYHKGLGLTFEYRFYPGFNSHFIKKGFLSYDFSSTQRLEFGVTQVPFGMLEFLGNSWWFQLPYYVGLEDDYDTGIKYRWETGNWNFTTAFFLMAEPRGVSEPDFGSYASARYSYDVIPEDGYNGNKERSQGNVRIEYAGDKLSVGVSGQGEEIFNSNNGASYGGYAAALHSKWNLSDNMSVKFQATHYDFPTMVDDAGNRVEHLNVGGYGFGTYEMATNATILSLDLAWGFPVDWGPISKITIYEGYSYMHKYGDMQIGEATVNFEPSHHNIFGFLVEAGFIYAYFDVASGINQPWLSNSFGGTALSSGRGEIASVAPGTDVSPEGSEEAVYNPIDRSPPINTRLNLNLGVYFMRK